MLVVLLASTTIDFNSHRRLGEGAYAHVFQVNDRALKLFLCLPQFPPKQIEEGRRRTYNGQCNAHQLACSDSWLKKRVDEFYGPCLLKMRVAHTTGAAN